MKKILISLLAVILTTGLFAAQRTAEEAAAIAKQVNYSNLPMVIKKGTPALVPQRQDHSVRLVHTQLQPKSDKAAFYVFDRDQQGFVIVSADDNTRDVLAYSDEGTFSDQVPDNVQFLLDYMAERIERASQAGQPMAASASYTPVAPLLDGIQWDQDAPYNNKCPIDVKGNQSVTGCVATAMAQIMRYWSWPTKGTGSHSYTTKNVSGTLSANFGATTYDWANMPKTTSGYTTSAQKNAVATLMYHAGVSVEMAYTGTGSSAFSSDVPSALVDYFGYKNTLQYVCTYENEESSSTTASKMRADLAKGHPVYVSGTGASATTGHAFVFEGYDANGLFYVNWGWSGYYNGYYAIDNLAPGGSGIGGNSDSYSYNLEYITGIEPNGSVTPPTPSAPTIISGLQYGEAFYTESEGDPLWYVDLYKNKNGSTITNPEVYLIFYAKSKTVISGTYNMLMLEYTTAAGETNTCYNGAVTISPTQDGKFRFEGSFYDTKGKAYAFDQEISLSAYDYDHNYEEITIGDKTIVTGLNYGQAYYMTYGTTAYWFVVLFHDYIDGAVPPEVDFYIEAKSKTALVGTYDLISAAYISSAYGTIPGNGEGGTVTITNVGQDRYRFKGSFVGIDGLPYEFDQTVYVWAYDCDNDNADINLMDSRIPTVSDLTSAGYNVTNSRVICIRPDEQVCNPIVWAGTYNNWNTDPSQMLKFEALAGFDGWYVVAVNDNSASVEGKPVQLKLDGSFSWDFQSGDYDAWINKNQPGTQTAIVNPGYDGEANCQWPNKGAYIYELAYWKKHNTPCVAVPKHDYTITLYAPKFCEAIANYADSVRIMGAFDNWTMGKLMEKRVDANNQIYYYTTLPNTEENTEFKFRCGSMSWDFQILYNGYELANEKTGTETDLVYYYNGKGYNWTFCPEPVYLTVNSNDYSHSITMGSGTYDKDANVLIMAANTDEDYVFDQWNDGNKAAARYVTVSEDVTYTAFFVPKSSETCIEVASNDETLGIAVVAVMALPINGGTFLNWDDGNTNNPRVINELDGTLYTAIFTTGTPTDMQKVEGNDDQAVRKIIKDDRLYIIRNGIEYIATGARTK